MAVVAKGRDQDSASSDPEDPGVDRDLGTPPEDPGVDRDLGGPDRSNEFDAAEGRAVRVDATPDVSHFVSDGRSSSGSTQVPLRGRTSTRGVGRTQMIVKHKSTMELLYDFYEEDDEIGSGAFGTVSTVIDGRVDASRVSKEVITKNMSAANQALMKQEIDLALTLDHPHVVKLFEYADQGGHIVMIFEHLMGGTCRLVMEDQGPYDETLLSLLVQQVLCALSYCHGRCIVHRDIKPDNLGLMSSDRCKLIDFGVSGRTRKKGHLEGCIGTPAYVAPEVMSHKEYDFKADMWSLGVTVLELLTGREVFGRHSMGAEEPEDLAEDRIFENIKKYRGESDLDDLLRGAEGWSTLSELGREFIGSTLVRDPDVRPTSQAAASMSWFAGQRVQPGQFDDSFAAICERYANAPPVVRCCALVIATRIGVEDLAQQAQWGDIFVATDRDGDGVLGRADVANALPSHAGDVDRLFDSIDMDHSDNVSFCDFTAACLLAAAGSWKTLMKRAFDALDHDRDGYVSVSEIRHCFRERDAPTLDAISQDQLDKKQWADFIHGVLIATEGTDGAKIQQRSFAFSDDSWDAASRLSRHLFPGELEEIEPDSPF